MKRNYFLKFLFLFFVISSCKKTSNENSTVPTVVTYAIGCNTDSTAEGGGKVTKNGGQPLSVWGLCWSTAANPTTADAKTELRVVDSSFYSTITGLIRGTTYHVRAYATNLKGTAYGNDITFVATNVASVPPSVTTTKVSNIAGTTATSGGSITADCPNIISARGVCWSATGVPSIAGAKTVDGTGTGAFTSNITGLAFSTTYYVRAYVTAAGNTRYGTVDTFTTLTGVAVLPTLTTTAASSVVNVSASSGGNISSDGGAVVTARGVCWSTSVNPTITDSKTTNGTGAGSFASVLSSLTPSTTYHVRAYATNSVGTAYGNEITLTTTAVAPSLATITTTAVSGIANTAANSGGNITADGGSAVTARGVCWSTSANPTIANSKTTNGSGTGTFSSALSGLTAGTAYHVRAYATNGAGTAYGNDLTFTTTGAVVNCGTVTDVDGNVYNVVSIGTQCWTKENLKVTKYSNGDAILNVTDASTWSGSTIGLSCAYKNNSANVATYGLLYNFYAVSDSRNVCPTGFHVPTDAEWNTLVTFLGGTSVAGKKLKEAGTSHWINFNQGDNSSGFKALPGSFRDVDGTFSTAANAQLGEIGIWWSATPVNTGSATAASILGLVDNIYINSSSQKDGMSIRCVKN